MAKAKISERLGTDLLEQEEAPTKKDEDRVLVSKNELDDLRMRVYQTDQLIKEVSGRRQSEEEIQRKAAEMVKNFKSQRHAGEHRYLVWDSSVVSDEEADKYGKIFHCDVPHTKPQSEVLKSYNSIMKRSVEPGRETLKFKPVPPA